MSDSEDEGRPQLSSRALAALQEFYAEQQQHHSDLRGDDKYNIGIIEENWQLSQFWYSPETALRLAEDAVAAAGEGGSSSTSLRLFMLALVHLSLTDILPEETKDLAPSSSTAQCFLSTLPVALPIFFMVGLVACVSAPSVYQKLRERHRDNVSVCIFEYDRRFAVYGEDFVYYDYKSPVDLPERIATHSFDIVVADPPYLSEECLRKMSETIKLLTREKIMLCTGAVMEEAAEKLLGVKMCKFIPEHTRALGNEFRCFVNYDSGLDRDLSVQLSGQEGPK
ncbi:EEF1A lysine methyltransferase 1 isoform X1 [Odocoileus virginianus]|uniref:EEF1A lysine methyltransferase 1 n=2 Tax=Odocoileus virginianus TaxID=9874 RepID=A0A6J0XAJ9_ODOVR|nr:protein-lysine N-methyltransferase N6AMT2 isoform X2 [Odocoileus virginianus texanus]XP_020746850.1 protein-lysine N-methyltransferase N6AMT2 isoform X2 [Odocoileus virginianus texanus]XP_020746851.1 protein-lysine N-methyltransferase N6AMT2 isoform X2 [Odocoileus virginianus texanus]XP_020746852.1 protein-lysine N-methyltransferase N6AMT2 isoform X2 [Odocoileus virginianus texanus]